MTPGSFHNNAFWLYEQEDTPYYFLFIKEGAEYRHGDVIDLIPRRLLSGLDGSTGRGGAKVDVVLEALYTAYQQLSIYHPDYGARYIQLANYISQLDNERSRLELGQGAEFYNAQKRSDNSMLVQQEGLGEVISSQPDFMAREAISRTEREDERNTRRRDERLPNSTTRVHSEIEPLPVAARPVRFLEDDGTTRIELYWGITTARSGNAHRNPASK